MPWNKEKIVYFRYWKDGKIHQGTCTKEQYKIIVSNSFRRFRKSFLEFNRNGKERWDFPHAYTDLFTEPGKFNYYEHGHWFMVITTLLLISNIIWITLWLKA